MKEGVWKFCRGASTYAHTPLVKKALWPERGKRRLRTNKKSLTNKASSLIMMLVCTYNVLCRCHVVHRFCHKNLWSPEKMLKTILGKFLGDQKIRPKCALFAVAGQTMGFAQLFLEKVRLFVIHFGRERKGFISLRKNRRIFRFGGSDLGGFRNFIDTAEKMFADNCSLQVFVAKLIGTKQIAKLVFDFRTKKQGALRLVRFGVNIGGMGVLGGLGTRSCPSNSRCDCACCCFGVMGAWLRGLKNAARATTRARAREAPRR